jgi:hypothetical protein
MPWMTKIAIILSAFLLIQASANFQSWGGASILHLPLVLRAPAPCKLSASEAIRPGARTDYPFDRMLSCLNTPDTVSQFTQNNITYDLAYAQQACQALGGTVCYFPARTVYEQGADVCRGFAILQSYLLESNGWDAYMIGLSIESATVGHNVCGVNVGEKILVLDNGWIEGTFDTLADIARHYIAKGVMTPGGTLRIIRTSKIIQPVMDGNILALPWVLH